MQFILANAVIERLTQLNVIIGIVLAILGVVMAILARRVAKVIRKTDEIADGDNIVLTFKIIGLALILIALIVIVLDVRF